MKHTPSPHRQRGVAVIMALLLTTLSITIVASLFWQQQVQVRLIENQRLQLQKQWILRGALDWASLILREDAKYSSVDTLDEPWATPLAETRLDQYVENGKADGDVADTTLSGQISDAQARFNLSNLAPNGAIDPAAVAAYAKLLTLLQLNPSLAQQTAEQLALATPQLNFPTPTANNNPQFAFMQSRMGHMQLPPPTPQVNPQAAAQAAGSEKISASAMRYIQVEDLLAIPNYTPAVLAKLQPYVIFLPHGTPLNINTATAEVISAMIANLSLAEANALIATRKSAYFRDLADMSNRIAGKNFNGNNFSVDSRYFLINGKVQMNRARLDMQALLERNATNTQTLWIHEF